MCHFSLLQELMQVWDDSSLLGFKLKLWYYTNNFKSYTRRKLVFRKKSWMPLSDYRPAEEYTEVLL